MMGLAPLEGAPKRMRFAVYDLEWYPGGYELRLFGVRDESGYRGYTSVREFLEKELTRDSHGMCFFAHAGGLADIQFVLDELVNRRQAGDESIHIDAAMSGSAAIRVTVKRGAHKWLFADSYWLFRDRLSRIGDSLGHKKASDYRCPNWPGCAHFCDARKEKGTCKHLEDEEPCCLHCVFYAPMPTLRSYNERDCEILWLALHRFQDEVNDIGGQMKRTIASTGLDVFRRVFLQESIPTSGFLNENMRPAYIASRVEPFKPRANKANYFDINSSFPASMMQSQPGLLVGKSKRWNGSPIDFIRARITVPDMHVPPLPYRTPKRSIFFPTGSWTNLFTGTDLALLQECGGRIDKILSVHHFAPFSALAEYVNEIYGRRRRETDPFRKIVYKYLLNCLYGKFGEKSEKRRLLFTDADESELPPSVEWLRPGVYLVTENARVPHAHVPISASITSMSRALLTRYLWQGAADGHDLYYCDTDSIVTTADLSCAHDPTCPSLKAADPKKHQCAGCLLGDLKLECRIQEGHFLAPKFYRIDSTVHAKGFSTLSPAEFEALGRGASKTVRRMARIYETIVGDGARMCAPTDRIYEKHARFLARPKRKTVGDGTRAWTVKELAS